MNGAAKARSMTALFLSFAISCARAEKFLSPEEAARVCFTNAIHLERQTISIRTEDKGAIEKASGVRGVPREQAVWVVRDATNVLGCIVIDRVIGKHDFIDYAVAISTN